MIGKSLNKFLAVVGIQLKSTKALCAEKAYYTSLMNGLTDLFKLHKQYQGATLNNQIEGLIFSKDRTMQLHALLTSYFKRISNPAPLTVLYKASNEQFKCTYNELINEVSSYPVNFIEETNFHQQVTVWVSRNKADRLFFLTDDAIIIEEFDLNDVLQFDPLDTVFSLTKGTDLTFCFNHNRSQKLPAFKKVFNINNQDEYFLEWNWAEMIDSPDWIYPLSLDGTFFSTKEMEILLKNIVFRNPNSMEANLQVFIQAFLPRKGACYSKAKYVNIPCNLVQTEVKNRTTTNFTVEELNAIWNKGKRIDIDKFWKKDVKSAQTMKFDFK